MFRRQHHGYHDSGHPKGAEIFVTAEGVDADRALDAIEKCLSQLAEKGFLVQPKCDAGMPRLLELCVAD